ncbi:MAG TPA: GNAT family N-acetyltransferase, partial [Candidatus Limnocylindria bacterium]|nr:GNAT family N-acetyltransferase [Candidatus Limnocylindria bacterium]
MDVNGYSLDRADPRDLPESEQIAIARLFQRMTKEILPEDPERPIDAILPRLRANVPNQWVARVRARDTRGNVVGVGYTSRSLNEPENAHVLWTEISVHPDHRRKGLGRAILAHLVAAAEGQNPKLTFTGMTNDRI